MDEQEEIYVMADPSVAESATVGWSAKWLGLLLLLLLALVGGITSYLVFARKNVSNPPSVESPGIAESSPAPEVSPSIVRNSPAPEVSPSIASNSPVPEVSPSIVSNSPTPEVSPSETGSFPAPKVSPSIVSNPPTPEVSPSETGSSPLSGVSPINPSPSPTVAGVTEAEGEILYFDFDSTEISSSEVAKLEVLFAKMQGKKGTLMIEGHSDDLGSEEYNQFLSTQRAEQVAELLERLGMGEGYEVEVRGVGESRPARDNDTEENRSLNRRVVIDFVGGE